MNVDEIGVREAARQLGVHENTIRNWEKRGILKAAAVLPSGYRRFARADIQRMRDEMWSSPRLHPPADGDLL